MNENSNARNDPNSRGIYATVSNVVEEIVDKTVLPPNFDEVVQSTASADSKVCVSRPTSDAHTSGQGGEAKPTLEIYRAMGQFSESQSDLDVGISVAQFNEVQRNSPPVPSMPPSYSTVIKQGRPSLDIRRDVRSMEVQHISPFRRVPPPSYAEVHGVWSREISNASSEQVLFGPDPIYIWCSRCATIVVTATQAQRSKFTHFTAVALCLFGCWPCALMPYCMNSCKNTYHYCPDCNYLFGMYRPW